MADSNKSNPYSNVINEAAAKYGIDPAYLSKLLEVESRFDPNAVSPTGPRGIAQFTKSTGARYGLVKDEDFFDPVKSINAAAAHINDLLKTNNQDYVKTALAYNQGEGTLGKPQLEAYDKNDYSLISKEGLKYIQNFRDWDNGSNSVRTDYLLSGKINSGNYMRTGFEQPDSPVSKTGYEAGVFLGSNQNEIKSDTDNYPRITQFGMTGGVPIETPDVNPSYEQSVYEADQSNQSIGFGETVSLGVQKTVAAGIYSSFKHAPDVATGFTVMTDRIRGVSDYMPDEDDFKYARAVGVEPEQYSILSGATTKDNFKQLADEAVRLQKVHKQYDASDSTSGKTVGFLADVLLDPTTYVGAGVAVKGMKVGNALLTHAVEGIAYTVPSAYLHEKFAGEQANYTNSIIFGAALGGTFHLAGRGISAFGSSKVGVAAKEFVAVPAQRIADRFSETASSISQRMEARESAVTLGGERLDVVHIDKNTKPDYVSDDGIAFWNHPHDPEAVVMADGTVIAGGNLLNPKTINAARAVLRGEIPPKPHATPDNGTDSFAAASEIPTGATTPTDQLSEADGISVPRSDQTGYAGVDALENTGNGARRGEGDSIIDANTVRADHYPQSELEANSNLSTDGIESAAQDSGIGNIKSNTQSGKPEDITFETNPTPELDSIHLDREANIISAAADKVVKPVYANLGVFTEIGNATHASNDEFVRGLGANLFRPTMTTAGNRGLATTVAADVIDRLKALDGAWSDKYGVLESKALKDVRYSGMPKMQAEDTLNRRVTEAIEDTTNAKLHNLTEDERNLAEQIRNNFIAKEEMMVDTARFGKLNAINMLDEKTFHSGNYVPRFYNKSKIMELKERLELSGIEDVDSAATKIVKEGFMKAYFNNPAMRLELERQVINDSFESTFKRVSKPERQSFNTADEFTTAMNAYKEQEKRILKAVDEKVEKTSYGIVNGGENNIGSLMSLHAGMGGDTVATRSANDFLKTRLPLGTDQVVQLPDGSNFSINDIRDFDLHTIIPSYNSSVRHGLGIHAVGLTEEGLVKSVNENHARLLAEGNKKDADIVMEAYKIIAGKARYDNPEGIVDNLIGALNSTAYSARNTYFGVMSLTEVGNMMVQSTWRSLLDNIPILRDAFAYNTKEGRETIKELHSLLYGVHVDKQVFRPRWRDRYQVMMDDPKNGAPAMAMEVAARLRGAADTMAHYSPGNYMLRGTTNAIINTARQTFLTDIIRHVHEGKSLPKYLRGEGKLNGLSITDKNLSDVVDLIKTHIDYKSSGAFSLKDVKAFDADPRSAILFRMGDMLADKAILRPESLSNAQRKQLPRVMKLLTQFKMFSVRSINGRMMQLYGDTRYNRQCFDNAMELVASSMLAGLGYIGQTYGTSQTMPENQRFEYLDRAFDPSTLAFNIASRTSIAGGPIGLASTLYTVATGAGPGKFLRSTVTPSLSDEKESSIFKGAMDRNPAYQQIASRIIQQSPSLSVGADIVGSAYYTAAALLSGEYTNERIDNNTAAFNNLRGILPNNPLTFLFLNQIFSQAGIDTQYK
ncbi:TPA: transglycosylase SLT domain-containing protein [Kluyvera georgiana]